MYLKLKDKDEEYEPYLGNIILADKGYVPDKSPDVDIYGSEQDDADWDFEHRETWWDRRILAKSKIYFEQVIIS